ncbi:MAG TPA: alpha/beta fold hydrolase [Anaerolineaceae bacterium]|nr:alpha/beta fold hydrolase [Anaerolineaceae bacterium]
METFLMHTAEPFLFKGDDLGFLLIHGFTGTPKEMRLLGEHLAAQGHTILGIRLPGHATRIEDMRRMRWQDWAAAVEDGVALLRSCCSKVISVGLSMGGALSMYAAANFDLNAAVALSAPYVLDDKRLPLLRPLSLFKPYLAKGRSDMKDAEQAAVHANYTAYPTKSIIELDQLLKATRAVLPYISIPVLLIHSKADQGVSFRNLERYYKKIGSNQKTKLELEKSGHVVTEDIEREVAFQAISDFAQKVMK